MKRPRGRKWRYKPCNVHRKAVTTKDIKAKGREESHLRLLNVFVVIGYNYRKIITYTVPNGVGKMTTHTYTQQVLPQLLDDFHRLGLTLCQDADSAHTSNGTMKWARENNLPMITLPGVSQFFHHRICRTSGQKEVSCAASHDRESRVNTIVQVI